VELVIFAGQHSMMWANPVILPGNNSSKGSVDDLNRLGGYVVAMAQTNSDQARMSCWPPT
jgi:hypothetical protein